MTEKYYAKLISKIIAKQLEFQPDINVNDYLKGITDKANLTNEEFYELLIEVYKDVQTTYKRIEPNTIYVNDENYFVYVKKVENYDKIFAVFYLNNDLESGYFVDEYGEEISILNGFGCCFVFDRNITIGKSKN